MAVIRWMKEEAILIIPAVIYFCIAFNLIYFTSGLMLKPDDFRYFNYLEVTIGALLVGKILIVARALPFLDLFPNRPLVYNIIWKFFIYICCVLIVWVADSLLQQTYRYSFEYAYLNIQTEFTSPIFFVTFLWLLITFFIFTVFSEFIQRIGKKEVYKMLFG